MMRQKDLWAANIRVLIAEFRSALLDREQTIVDLQKDISRLRELLFLKTEQKGGERQMVDKVRGKFFVIGLEKHPHAQGTTIKLGAVAKGEKEDDENSYFNRYTPTGTIQMFVDNPP